MNGVRFGLSIPTSGCRFNIDRERIYFIMKTTSIFMASVVLFWSAAASADAYLDCSDAYNSGSNQAIYFVSGIYNKAKCNRIKASRYEDYVFDIIPTYLAAESATTTPEKAACMLQGSFAAWMDTILDEYKDCVVAGEFGFETVQRRLLGMVAGPLLSAFYFEMPPESKYFTPAVVTASFTYDFYGWPLVGTASDCEAQIDVDTLGVPLDLVAAVKGAVCNWDITQSI